MLLLYAAICFNPTAPTMTTITHHYNTLPQNTSVMGPYNTRYNSKWVLRCGDLHPDPGHRGIYHLRRDCRLVPRPPVPLLNKENYPQHLLVNTNRQYDNVDKAAEGHDRDMKLATWNIQSAQGTVSLQRWANILHLIQQCRIDLCGIQEYNLGFPLPEAATTPLNNDYKCYTAPGTEPRIAFLVCNAVVPHVLETICSPNGLAGVLRLQLPNGPRRTIACVYSEFSRPDKQEVDLFLETMKPSDILMGDYNDDILSANPTRPWQ